MDCTSADDISIQRKNLCRVLCLIVKAQCDLDVQCSLDENFREVVNLIVAFENVFYHGFRFHWRSKLRKCHPWNVLILCLDSVDLEYVDAILSLGHLKNDFAKLRGWIKLCLMKCVFHRTLFALKDKIWKLRDYYHTDALLLHEDFTHILEASSRLELLRFSLDLKDPLINYKGVRPVDYTAYMVEHASLERTLNPISECDIGSYPSEHNCQWRRAFQCLQNTNKRISEQQRYVEDLLNQKQTQLNDLQKQLTQSKSYNCELQSLVLNLQVKLALYHEQYSAELIKLKIDPTSVLSTPPAHNWLLSSSNRGTDLTNTHSFPSLVGVDQGIDALTFDYCTVNQSELSDTPPVVRRPWSMYLASNRMELNNSASTTLSGQPLIDDRRSVSDMTSSRMYTSTISSTDASDGSKSRTLAAAPKTAVRFGFQKLPKGCKQFVFPHTNLQHSISVGELPNASSYELCNSSNPRLRPTNQVARLRSFDMKGVSSTSRRHPSSKLANRLEDGAAPAQRKGSRALFNTQPDQSDELTKGIDEVNQSALVDSQTSSELPATSPERDLREFMVSAKDYYQLTSQSEEDFLSDNEASALNLAKPDDTVVFEASAKFCATSIDYPTAEDAVSSTK